MEIFNIHSATQVPDILGFGHNDSVRLRSYDIILQKNSEVLYFKIMEIKTY